MEESIGKSIFSLLTKFILLKKQCQYLFSFCRFHFRRWHFEGMLRFPGVGLPLGRQPVRQVDQKNLVKRPILPRYDNARKRDFLGKIKYLRNPIAKRKRLKMPRFLSLNGEAKGKSPHSFRGTSKIWLAALRKQFPGVKAGSVEKSLQRLSVQLRF